MYPGVARFLPFLAWRPLLTRQNLRADVGAGLTVALVLVPQSLAYAQLAGMPPHYGLYAALLPTLLGALFGSSRQLSTGPVALTSLLTAAVIGALAPSGSAEFISYAITLALISGVFQLAFGMLRLGVLLNLLSHPVLIGFVHAAAILIMLAQLPAFLGLAPPAAGHALTDAWVLLSRLDDTHLPSLAFGCSAFVLLVALRRFRRWPGVLITVALAILASALLDFAGSGGATVGTLPSGLPEFGLPRLHVEAWPVLLPGAFALALIGFMEAAASAKLAAMRTGQRWQENQELIGQGLAKLGAAFSQTMPVSGSFSRTAINLQAGARTGLSAAVTALCVLLSLFFTPLIEPLPHPVLAAVVMVALVGLMDLRGLRNTWKASADDAVSAALTFGATLAFSPNIQNGIFAGILTSLALFIYRRMRPNILVIEPGSEALKAQLPAEACARLAGRVAIVRFDASLFFVNASYFENAILRLLRLHPELKFILVSAHSMNLLDATGIHMLNGLIEGLEGRGAVLLWSGTNAQVRGVLERTGLAARIGAANFFPADAQALAALARREDEAVA